MISKRHNRTGRIQKKTSEEFIKELKIIFKDKYDYSKVKYDGKRVNVKLICKTHGKFTKKPERLLLKYGCKDCRVDVERNKFLSKAKKIHKNLYDYSKVNFVNAKTKVTIICQNNLHGEWQTTPANHTAKKSGCPACGFLKVAAKQRKTKEVFIKEVKKISFNRYTYRKVEYINAYTPVIITCKKHGDFSIAPTSILQGSHCWQCSRIESGLKRRKSTESFIEQANKIHNGKYNYSKTKYVRARLPITIICSKHKDFKQLPYVHLGGIGCKDCGNALKRKRLRKKIT